MYIWQDRWDWWFVNDKPMQGHVYQECAECGHQVHTADFKYHDCHQPAFIYSAQNPGG